MLSPLLVTAPAAGDGWVTVLVILSVITGIATAFWFATRVKLINVPASGSSYAADSKTTLLSSKQETKEDDGSEFHMSIADIQKAVADGANAFLFQEYEVLGVFMLGFAIVLLILLGTTGTHGWGPAVLATIAFLSGALTSTISGFIGMRIAVYTNARTALSAQRGFEWAFDTAFKGGAVMGFALVSLGLIVLFILINAFQLFYDQAFVNQDQTTVMFEALAGYGLGGSAVALFGRVGGGIYTKAADVGADLAGKVEAGLREDDPRNPAVIADNVGDNVGDIAGMGADLFGSFAESSCAAMVISSQSPDLYRYWPSMTFPLVLTATGIFVCLATSFVATHLIRVKSERDVEPSLKRQLLVSTVLMTPVVIALAFAFFPSEFQLSTVSPNDGMIKNWYIAVCVLTGLYSGLTIGYVTEYYTSHSYTPVREVAGACSTGAATNIIYGLALGYKSVIIPVFCLALTIFISYSLAYMYGIAVAALGILSTLAIGLTIDAYGPICDNAGGLAEMSGMPHEVRDITDALDAAGNTTAAIGKGFAIGSAALVSLALFGAYVTVVQLPMVNILNPYVFAGLLVGAMLPYWYTPYPSDQHPSHPTVSLTHRADLLTSLSLLCVLCVLSPRVSGSLR